MRVGGVHASHVMRIGLVVYGRLDTLTGGYLYNRFLVEALRGRGHRVEVISLALKPYPLRLLDNLFWRPVRRPAERAEPLLLALAAHAHQALAPVNVLRGEAAKFADAQAAGVNRFQDSHVTPAGQDRSRSLSIGFP